MRLMPDLEEEELALIYEAKGLPADQARQTARAMMQDPVQALNAMVREELNIHPAELENVLADCPGIAEAAVVGVEDAKWGEAACACVVSSLSEKEILGFLEGKLARYKHPRRVAYFDALPRNAMGKVLKSELRAALASRGEGKR